MGITLPTDGQGVYESINTLSNSAAYQPRLQQIAAGGFKLVLNYNLLFGHATDMVAYINYAATQGLKVIVPLHDPAIWKNNAIGATYATMSGDAGSTTDNGFTTYIVNQVKALAGTWGYYVGDEVANADHAPLKTHTDIVHTADSAKPRLFIAAGNAANAVASGTNAFTDCCEVMGDDYYPVAYPPGYTRTTAQQAAAIQSFDTTNSKGSVMVLQSFSWVNHGYPYAPWPTEAQMAQMRTDTLNNMTPRLLLWWNYYEVITTGSPYFAPISQWSNLVNASQNRSNLALFPSATRRGLRR